MRTLGTSDTPPATSPLVLADRLISLAQDADRAGYAGAAGRLVRLACKMLEERPKPS